MIFSSGEETRALQKSAAWKTPMELKTGDLVADEQNSCHHNEENKIIMQL